MTRATDDRVSAELSRLQHELVAATSVPAASAVVGRAAPPRRPPTRRGPGIRRHPVLVGLVVGLVVLVAGLAWTTLRPPTYTASGVLSFAPRDPAAVPADTVEMVARAYVAYLSSPDIVARAATAADTSPEVVADRTSVAVENGTANVRISVGLATAGQAADVVNRLGAAGADHAASDPLVTAMMVSPAAPEATTQPARLLLAAAAALAGLLAGVLATALLSHHRDRHVAS